MFEWHALDALDGALRGFEDTETSDGRDGEADHRPAVAHHDAWLQALDDVQEDSAPEAIEEGGDGHVAAWLDELGRVEPIHYKEEVAIQPRAPLVGDLDEEEALQAERVYEMQNAVLPCIPSNPSVVDLARAARTVPDDCLSKEIILMAESFWESTCLKNTELRKRALRHNPTKTERSK